MTLLLAAAMAAGLAAPAQAPAQAPAAADKEPAATLAEMVRAVNAGDARAYAGLYAPDAVLTIYGDQVLTGRKAIEDHETGLLREFPGARLGFRTIWQQESLAVASLTEPEHIGWHAEQETRGAGAERGARFENLRRVEALRV